MRNLQYPLDWEAIFEYVGFPAFLKPFDGGGWRDVYKVNNREEFFAAYDQTRTLCMTLQRGVDFKEYFRCYVVGQEEVHIMPYDPRAPFHERYVMNPPAYPKDAAGPRRARCAHAVPGARLRPQHRGVRGRGRRAVRHRLHESGARRRPALGRARRTSTGSSNAVAELAVKKATEPAPPATYRWDALLKGSGRVLNGSERSSRERSPNLRTCEP